MDRFGRPKMDVGIFNPPYEASPKSSELTVSVSWAFVKLGSFCIEEDKKLMRPPHCPVELSYGKVVFRGVDF